MEAKTQRAYIQESLVVLLPFHSAAENGSNPNRWYHNTDLELLQHASSPPSFINSGGKKSTFKIGRAGRDSLMQWSYSTKKSSDYAILLAFQPYQTKDIWKNWRIQH